ncbi:hypothetical protein COCCADRAFT_104001 [Bipolaris zeicola 26-R-13]|uniref:Uncharacterized protein n=1 Tax=Cochliobolus carbonum (strain 26-R-13) TaxID=930089 RepID=W6XS89_COCC2|nr:uncharacterized protein COCCADRAFT_104001 [Bipolaris zeicola 26-R-13]EUC30402.1 hypothetical protein COCCADRAFT_104001 [Bipolaris zeicola 26-R-13]
MAETPCWRATALLYIRDVARCSWIALPSLQRSLESLGRPSSKSTPVPTPVRIQYCLRELLITKTLLSSSSATQDPRLSSTSSWLQHLGYLSPDITYEAIAWVWSANV